MSRFGRIRAAASVCALVASIGSARASEGALKASARAPSAATFLDWEAPASCPDAAAAYETMRDAAGFPPERGRFQRVRGVIVRAPTDFRLTLEFAEGSRRTTRSLTAPDCDELGRAAGVAVALALGDEPASSELSPALETGGPLTGAPVPARPAGQGRAAFAAGAVLDAPSLSGAAWGATLEAGVRVRRLELGLSGIWLPARRLDVGGGEWVEFSLIAAGPRGCYRALDGALSAKLCGGFELGRITADGAGLSAGVRRSTDLWLAPAAGVELEARSDAGWLVRLHGDVLRPLVREQYTVNGSDVVHVAPELAARLGLGAGLVLP